jgi:hypothetical protein
MLRMNPPYPARSGPGTNSVVRILTFGNIFDDAADRGPEMSDMGLEEPVPDSVEQKQDAIPAAHEDENESAPQLPLEADEADAAEQAQELDLDDDDYR